MSERSSIITYELGLSDGGNHNIGLANHIREVLGAGVADSKSRVFVEQHQGNGNANQVATYED